MADRTLPAPGWYADTLDPNLQRYWDGHAWTDDSRPNPGPRLPPPPAPSAPKVDQRSGQAFGLGIGAVSLAAIASWIVDSQGWLDSAADDAARGFVVIVGLLVLGIIGSGIWLGRLAPQIELARAAASLSAAIAVSMIGWGAAVGADDGSGGLVLLAVLFVFPIAMVLALIGLGIGRFTRRG